MIFQRYINGKAPAHVKIRELFDSASENHASADRKLPIGYDAEYVTSGVSRPNDLSTIQWLLAQEDGVGDSGFHKSNNEDVVRNKRKAKHGLDENGGTQGSVHNDKSAETSSSSPGSDRRNRRHATEKSRKDAADEKGEVEYDHEDSERLINNNRKKIKKKKQRDLLEGYEF